VTWTPEDVKKIDAQEAPNYLNILPDSRTKAEPKGVIRGNHPLAGSINWQPVFCANCGVLDGFYPTENINFAFALCPPCAEKWGHVAGTWVCPDEVFWKEVECYQIEKYGRVLSKPELLKRLESDHQFQQLLKSKGG